MARKSNTLTFRLRKIDTDLLTAINDIDSATLSELCRDGLRLILGIRTTRRVEVTEKPLTVPAKPPQRPIEIPSKPAIFIPNKKA